MPGSEPKFSGFTGKKRAREEVEGSSKLVEKCVKMRDFDSVIRSEERRTGDIVPKPLVWHLISILRVVLPSTWLLMVMLDFRKLVRCLLQGGKAWRVQLLQ